MNPPPLWDGLIANLPGAHLLQTAEWAALKQQYGWQAHPYLWLTDGRMLEAPSELPAGAQVQAAALALQRRIAPRGMPLPWSMIYVPKGPLLAWPDVPLRRRVLADLQSLSRRRGAILVKIDPDLQLGSGVPGSPEEQSDPLGETIMGELQTTGWLYSAEQVQFRNTVLIDLQQSEDELLAAMKQKTRYNIRLAERKGITVRTGGLDDLDAMYRMYAETSLRDGFVIRERGYYLTLWQRFIGAGLADPLVADFEGEPVAGMLLFHFAGRAYFLHGMSRSEHREKMPGYLLQWAAMRRARELKCHTYDLWGAPETFTEGDPLWSVFRFKEGFNGRVVRTLGAYDYPVNPTAYRLFTQLLPRILEIMRRRGRRQTAANFDSPGSS
jgi:peptidoglycan pentaglycine glycine transferase (the first glycine)